MDRDEASYLDRTNLFQKGFIMWFPVKCFFRDIAGNPRSGGQSHRAIWFILATRGANHIINVSNGYNTDRVVSQKSVEKKSC